MCYVPSTGLCAGLRVTARRVLFAGRVKRFRGYFAPPAIRGGWVGGVLGFVCFGGFWFFFDFVFFFFF